MWCAEISDTSLLYSPRASSASVFSEPLRAMLSTTTLEVRLHSSILRPLLAPSMGGKCIPYSLPFKQIALDTIDTSARKSWNVLDWTARLGGYRKSTKNMNSVRFIPNISSYQHTYPNSMVQLDNSFELFKYNWWRIGLVCTKSWTLSNSHPCLEAPYQPRSFASKRTHLERCQSGRWTTKRQWPRWKPVNRSRVD